MSLRIAALLGALVFAVPRAGAQSTAPIDTIAEARRLRDARDYGAAAALLGPYVEAHPDDPGTARFAALMAYWSKDLSRARMTYEHALERHPDDTELRLDLAQFLVDVGAATRAREVLVPLDRGDSTSVTFARAQTLLGTLDYWSGDFSQARRRFTEALRVDSSNVAARRQLREIEGASAPWLRAGVTNWHDDQPLNHVAVALTGGWFATPVTPMTVRAGSTSFSRGGITETVSAAEGTIATFLPAARLDVAVAGGVLRRSFGDGSDWTGRITLGFRLPNSLVVEGRAERAPYFYTVRSLETPVMTQTVDGSARWRPGSGWMLDATVRRESFEDDNAVSTAYAWVLAPLVHRAGGDLHVGYSFAAQNARESRFVPLSELPFPPGQPPSSVLGIYDPYYTPSNQRVHSALTSVRLQAGARWALTGGAAYAFSARDEAPVLVPVLTPPDVTIMRTFAERDFAAWNVRGGIDGAMSDAVRLSFTAEHGEGAYYAFTTVGLRMTYTFLAAARHRADRY